MDPTDFLLRRIAEEEAVAQAAVMPDPPEREAWVLWTTQREPGRQTPRGSVEATPARVLAECESKRRIVAEHERGQYLSSYHCECCCTTSEATGEPRGEWPCLTLRLLALPYADHPDYDPSWAA